MIADRRADSFFMNPSVVLCGTFGLDGRYIYIGNHVAEGTKEELLRPTSSTPSPASRPRAHA